MADWPNKEIGGGKGWEGGQGAGQSWVKAGMIDSADPKLDQIGPKWDKYGTF